MSASSDNRAGLPMKVKWVAATSATLIQMSVAIGKRMRITDRLATSNRIR